jgi:hypothetical protein
LAVASAALVRALINSPLLPRPFYDPRALGGIPPWFNRHSTVSTTSATFTGVGKNMLVTILNRTIPQDPRHTSAFNHPGDGFGPCLRPKVDGTVRQSATRKDQKGIYPMIYLIVPKKGSKLSNKRLGRHPRAGTPRAG